jgi:hypothetical protein
MHEMDWDTLYEILDCDQVTGLQEFLRQLDERYVTVSDFEGYLKDAVEQRQCEWERMMDHRHGARGELVFPPTEPITVTRNMVGTCSPIEDDEIQPNTVCDSAVGCATFQEHWVVDTVTATQPKATCECYCVQFRTYGGPFAMILGQTILPRVLYCPWCGKPLKEEKP